MANQEIVKKFYACFAAYFAEIIKSTQYRKDDMYFLEHDHEFICNFEFFLKTKHGCLQNSTIKHIKKLNKVVDIAFSNGWIEKIGLT